LLSRHGSADRCPRRSSGSEPLLQVRRRASGGAALRPPDPAARRERRQPQLRVRLGRGRRAVRCVGVRGVANGRSDRGREIAKSPPPLPPYLPFSTSSDQLFAPLLPSRNGST